MTEHNISLAPLKDLVDGELVDVPAVGDWLQDPNTGADLQQMAVTPDATVERALAAAARVHTSGSWSSLSAQERAGWLMRLGDAVEAKAMESARLEALTTGATISTTAMLSFITHIAWKAAAMTLGSGWGSQVVDGEKGQPVEVLRLPWGPTALLVPWNAPAPMAAHKAASALAAGAPAILKPSEYAPNGSGVIAEAAAEIGLPAGVLQVLHGGPHTGGMLVTDERIRSVSFTGGLEGGRAIASACAPDFKPTQLELGGNNPVIVLPDADLDDAALGVEMLMTQLNGQWCRALGRLLVHESVKDELLQRVEARFAKLVIGHSLSADSQMGPIIHSNHLAGLHTRIDALVAAGGTAHAWTPLPEGPGNFLSPTLVTGASSQDALHEMFGPVGTVHTFRTDDEAVALANATPYGLEGYVFGADEDRAMAVGRRVRSGGIKINGATMLSLSMAAPRPAWGWSGFADEGTVESINFFCGTRVVGVEGMRSEGI
ncbi:MAG: acyl-CoA reductase-like NAD-dependent aldehyde dehydrogenase [Glaciecola sp.]|jgi:acyl-CoA reductase-like NAD-dependent aldehyde dehydrogenase